MKYGLLLLTFCAIIFLTSCGKETEIYPSEGYFEIEYTMDGEIFLTSIKPTNDHGGMNVAKVYYFQSLGSNTEIEIADPFCGSPLTMDITQIEYVADRDENGIAIFRSYTPQTGDKIIAKEIYFQSDNDLREDILQVTEIKKPQSSDKLNG